MSMRLLAPSWMDHIFGTGAVGELEIGASLFSSLLQAIDSSPLTRGCGCQIGVVGRAKHMDQPIRATRVLRAPDMTTNSSVIIYIGPALSFPPVAPDASRTHKIIAELFSTTLSCGLAFAGWVGTIASAGAIGATGGGSAFATVYFANAATLATAQCIGGVVHASMVLSDHENRAGSMDRNPGWQKYDRFADFFNLAALVYVGKDMLILKRALDATGVSLTSAMAAEIEKGGALTMARLMKLADDIDEPDKIAREIRTRVFNVALLGLGIYTSSRDAAGGYNGVRNVLVGEEPGMCKAPETPGGTPSRAAAALVKPVVQAGLPGPESVRPGSVAAPQIMNDMLRYNVKNGEVATISVALLKTKG